MSDQQLLEDVVRETLEGLKQEKEYRKKYNDRDQFRLFLTWIEVFSVFAIAIKFIFFP